MPPSDGNTTFARAIVARGAVNTDLNASLAKDRSMAICTAIIPVLVANITKSPDLFKKILLDATTKYQKKIKGQFFRTTGFKRAEGFKQALSTAKDFNVVLSAFDGVIQNGNEDHDSLKTSIIINIINKYCQKTHDVSSLYKFISAIKYQVSFFLKTLANELIVAAQPEMQFVRRTPGGPLELVEEKTVDKSIQNIM